MCSNDNLFLLRDVQVTAAGETFSEHLHPLEKARTGVKWWQNAFWMDFHYFIFRHPQTMAGNLFDQQRWCLAMFVTFLRSCGQMGFHISFGVNFWPGKTIYSSVIKTN